MTTIQRRTIAPPGQGTFFQPANPHRAGHYAGFHGEDQPFMSDDLEEDDRYYVTRQPTSARRYSNAPVRQGKPRYNVVQGPPPQVTRRRMHWLVYVGLFCMVAISGWLAISMIGAWWQGKQDDWTYGYPRTFQTDAVVGHSDSSSSPSHFIAENLRGQIIVVEYPGGDVSKARSYSITTLPGGNDYAPVKVSFRDIDGDGKLDMLIDIGDPGSQVQIILYNNGKEFVGKKP